MLAQKRCPVCAGSCFRERHVFVRCPKCGGSGRAPKAQPTTSQPALFDCHAVALPDEPTFTLLAHDPHAPQLLELWAALRAHCVLDGSRPDSDREKIAEALRLSRRMRDWRAANPATRWRT